MRLFSKFISIVFHPLLMLTYMLLLLLAVNPYIFGVSSVQANSWLVLLIFLSTFLIPAFSVLMMKTLGMVESLELKTKHERIGPYIVTGIFYLWMFVNFKNNPQIPTAYTSFVLGATIGLFSAFFINIFTKISAHAVGMGGLIAMVIITMLLFSYDIFTVNAPLIGAIEISMVALLMIVIVLAGMVGTARLWLDAHEPQDLYGGYLVGFVTQFIALFFVF